MSNKEIENALADTADPPELVADKMPEDIVSRYELHSFRNAAVILSESRSAEFADLVQALRGFAITTRMIRIAGGNESEIPKIISSALRPLEWHETTIQGDLHVQLSWKRQIGETPKGRPKYKNSMRELTRRKFLDGHKVDYVKGKVAFDLEWNSKDQTFDRDLYAFSAFFQTGVIDVGVLLTRSSTLDAIFPRLGYALDSSGNIDHKRNGDPRMTYEKYGASTTWMGKLIPRLNAGRNGGCPVLAIGITPVCIEDWKR